MTFLDFDDIDVDQGKNYAFTLILFMVFIFLVSILMLNVLVAMMNDTYVRVRETAGKKYTLEVIFFFLFSFFLFFFFLFSSFLL